MIDRSSTLPVFVFIGIPLTVLLAYFGLNYSGFCFAKMRYLSDEENIKLGFDALNNAEKLRINLAGKMQYSEFIKYKSFDEYIKENPDCCAINPPGGSDLPPPEYLERIFGYHSGKFVQINFKVRYLDEAVTKYQKIRADIPLQNCGKVVSFD
ncbi:MULTISPECIES: hypothetical protein [Nostoc]|uniref:Uncharacterized protein n=1 Tax=Nostoc paludosum FACHB-159 TaxID=2692908 RepID=A0ABR8KK29_9NOSO|nr:MULTISPECIES: hypothetical protein [Nostoc]MBD2682724.1 hypothetical protein [Nostoc sp. FACHB-857]MBD2739059.1 hypothetical protein [Nostoc paludosum FACHB-159]